MKKTLFILLLLYSHSAFSQETAVEFSQGWIKQLPDVVPVRAGYLTVINSSSTAQEIIAVESSTFEKVEIHETQMNDGVMQMVQQDSIFIAAESQVELKPGGKHLMLIRPQKTLEIDDIIQLTVTFYNGKTQPLQLKVKK